MYQGYVIATYTINIQKGLVVMSEIYEDEKEALRIAEEWRKNDGQSYIVYKLTRR